MEKSTITNFKVAKRILRYIKGTISYDMYYFVFDNYKLLGYNDNDWGRDKRYG